MSLATMNVRTFAFDRFAPYVARLVATDAAAAEAFLQQCQATKAGFVVDLDAAAADYAERQHHVPRRPFQTAQGTFYNILSRV